VADARSLLPALDLFVQPSDTEGLPNVVLEAAAAGLPIIATDTGGTSEIIDDEKSGVLVPVADASAMAHAIDWLAGDSALRRALGAAAREKVASEFGTQRFVDEVASLYNELLTKRGLAG
jgi:glycosyltransferase involved in cell wall biosynthesis